MAAGMVGGGVARGDQRALARVAKSVDAALGRGRVAGGSLLNRVHLRLRVLAVKGDSETIRWADEMKRAALAGELRTVALDQPTVEELVERYQSTAP